MSRYPAVTVVLVSRVTVQPPVPAHPPPFQPVKAVYLSTGTAGSAACRPASQGAGQGGGAAAAGPGAGPPPGGPPAGRGGRGRGGEVGGPAAPPAPGGG